MVKKALLFAITALLSTQLCISQTPAPALEWQKSLGSSISDVANCIEPAADGGYIVAGTGSYNLFYPTIDGDITINHGETDFWVVKLNTDGALQWQRSYGGNYFEAASSIKNTPDGGYIVAGYTASNNTGDVTGYHGGEDFWVVKINNTGAIQWKKCYGGTGSEKASSIEVTSDGGYIIAGAGSSNDGDGTEYKGAVDYWVVKINATGDIQWQKSYGGTNYDFATSIKPTPDGNYIIAGYSRSTDGDVTNHHGDNTTYDYWIVKINSTGTILWQKTLGGTRDETANAVSVLPNGNYIITGWSKSNDGDVTGHHGTLAFTDYWIVQLNPSGGIVWQKSLGGSDDDYGAAAIPTIDNGIIITGSSESNDGNITGHHPYDGYDDIWVVKLFNNGAIMWEKSLGGQFSDGGNSIALTPDGGYITVGYSRSNDGDVTGHHNYTSFGDEENYEDYWIVKLAKDGTLKQACEGAGVTITAPTTGSTYQWQQNTGSGYASINNNINVAGATTATLQLSNVPASWLGYRYRCVVNGANTAEFVLIVSSYVTPSVSIQASQTTVCSGANVTFFAVPVNEGATPQYQWKKNSVDVGANTKSYSDNTLNNADAISVIVTSGAACLNTPTATSNVITITVNPSVVPGISISGTTTVTQGNTTLLTATASNAGTTPAYQWQDSTGTHNWANINSATAQTLNYTPALTGNKIRCIVTSNAVCASPTTATSIALQFTVNAVTAIPAVPASQYSIQFYPNPVYSILTVDSLNLADNWQTLEIKGIDGAQTLARTTIHGQRKVTIHLQHIPGGLYIAILRRKNGTIAYTKFIKL